MLAFAKSLFFSALEEKKPRDLTFHRAQHFPGTGRSSQQSLRDRWQPRLRYRSCGTSPEIWKATQAPWPCTEQSLALPPKLQRPPLPRTQSAPRRGRAERQQRRSRLKEKESTGLQMPDTSLAKCFPQRKIKIKRI